MLGRKRKPKPEHVYHYVGDHGYLAAAGEDELAATRQRIAEAADINAWVGRHGDEVEFDGSVPACYVVDTDYQLWIASRYSEHVTLARGNPVLAAGEVFFGEANGSPTIERITNQSTGYGPEPTSWEIIHFALTRLEVPHPEEFDPACVFRWCKRCRNIEIVKDGVFECPICGADLPEEWNLDRWEPPEDEEEGESADSES